MEMLAELAIEYSGVKLRGKLRARDEMVASSAYRRR